jgi:hypothetical protein
MPSVADILSTCFDAQLALSPMPGSSLMPCMGGILSACKPPLKDTGLTACLPVPRRSAWEGEGWAGAKDQAAAWLQALQLSKELMGTAPTPATAATNSTPHTTLADITNQT